MKLHPDMKGRWLWLTAPPDDPVPTRTELMTPEDRLHDLLDQYDALRKHGAPSEAEYNRLMRRLQRHIANEASKMRAHARWYALDAQGRTMAGPLNQEQAEELQRAGIPVEKRLRW